jgi:hypothetical protein
MLWRKTVHLSQARSRLIPNEGGATIAGALESVRDAEGAAARDLAGKSFRAQEV